MEVINSIEKSIEDSVSRLKNIKNKEEVQVMSWPQLWPDDSYGFKSENKNIGPICAQTVVILGPEKDIAVYHGGKFAFYIENPKEDFWKRVRSFNLPGKNQILII